LLVKYSRDGSLWDISYVKDFSETGMKITTSGKCTPGEFLKFRVRIPLEAAFEWLEFPGKIVDSEALMAPGGGVVPDTYITRIQISGIEDDQKGLLRKYIEWFLKEQGK